MLEASAFQALQVWAPYRGRNKPPVELVVHDLVCVFPSSRYGAISVGYQCRAALGMAMTGNRDNETPVQPQSERDMPCFRVMPSQAMGAADL